MPVGDTFFTTVPEDKGSKRLECVIYNGPNLGNKINFIRNQDDGEMLIIRFLLMLDKQEKRIKALE